MTVRRSTSIMKLSRFFLFFMTAVICIAPVGGCSFIFEDKISRDISLLDLDMKSRVLILPFENRTFYDSRKLWGLFQKPLEAYIQKEFDYIVLSDPARSGIPWPLPKVEASGMTDNFMLARAGRELGLNAIVTGELSVISSDSKKLGLWVVGWTRKFIELRMLVTVYDPETGAKILDQVFIQKASADDIDIQKISSKYRGVVSPVDEALASLAEKVGDAVAETISEQPWKGFVRSINDDRIVITSGSLSGLSHGDVLEAYDSSTYLDGVNGHRFFKIGHQTGRVRITALFPDSSEATITTGEVLNTDSCLVPALDE